MPNLVNGVYIVNVVGVDSSEESDDGDEEKEVERSNEEGVATLSDTLQSLTLHTPVCHPDRLNKVQVHTYV